ncbi:MAG: site-specific integrase [Candidatus Absconditabacterales bacterium]|nr:site-specific integrase [Candidatus Absconditabacterales bacterium]
MKKDIEYLCEEFLNNISVKNNSKKTYMGSLKQFMEFFKKNDIKIPEPSLGIEYIDFLKIKELSDYTITNYIVILKKFFSWCYHEGYSDDITSKIKIKSQAKGFRKKTLSVEQIKKLNSVLCKDTSIGMRDYTIINLMIRTGLRTIEVKRLNFSDIKKTGDYHILYIHGKGRSGKDEFVFLTKKTYSMIVEYKKKLNSLQIPIDDNGAIFFSFSRKNYLKPLTTRSLSRIVKNSLSQIGLISKDYSAHSLRHTAITLCLLGGATIQEAQILARHNNINTTLIYAHNINRMKCAPEKYIDKLI